MKRFIAMLLVFCMVLGVAGVVMAYDPDAIMDAEELKEALADGVQTITLGADIDLTGEAIIFTYPITINGGGHTITGW